MSAIAESSGTRPATAVPTSSIHPPVPPRFPLRKLAHLAYGMSVTVGGLGQVLFLGERFGGGTAGWVAACGLAAFAEVCMVACGDWSLEHRARGRSWALLLTLGLAVAFYAATLNASHWWGSSKSLALMFAGASMIGFLLHVLNGHILVTAYLDDLAEYQSRTKVGQRAAEVAADTPGTRPDPSAEYCGTGAGTGSGTEPGTTVEAGPPPVSAAGLRLVMAATGTGPTAQAEGSAEWDRDLWERAVRTAREYRRETGTDVTVSDLRERLGIGRNRALALRRDVLESGLSTDASTESDAEPVPAVAR